MQNQITTIKNYVSWASLTVTFKNMGISKTLMSTESPWYNSWKVVGCCILGTSVYYTGKYIYNTVENRYGKPLFELNLQNSPDNPTQITKIAFAGSQSSILLPDNHIIFRQETTYHWWGTLVRMLGRNPHYGFNYTTFWAQDADRDSPKPCLADVPPYPTIKPKQDGSLDVILQKTTSNTNNTFRTTSSKNLVLYDGNTNYEFNRADLQLAGWDYVGKGWKLKQVLTTIQNISKSSPKEQQQLLNALSSEEICNIRTTLQFLAKNKIYKSDINYYSTHDLRTALKIDSTEILTTNSATSCGTSPVFADKSIVYF